MKIYLSTPNRPDQAHPYDDSMHPQPPIVFVQNQTPEDFKERMQHDDVNVVKDSHSQVTMLSNQREVIQQFPHVAEPIPSSAIPLPRSFIGPVRSNHIQRNDTPYSSTSIGRTTSRKPSNLGKQFLPAKPIDPQFLDHSVSLTPTAQNNLNSVWQHTTTQEVYHAVEHPLPSTGDLTLDLGSGVPNTQYHYHFPSEQESNNFPYGPFVPVDPYNSGQSDPSVNYYSNEIQGQLQDSYDFTLLSTGQPQQQQHSWESVYPPHDDTVPSNDDGIWAPNMSHSNDYSLDPVSEGQAPTNLHEQGQMSSTPWVEDPNDQCKNQ